MRSRNTTTVCLVSLGCPKNLVDSEKMLAALAQGGCVVGAPMEEADVIVVNTCGFLSAARDESLAVIREALSQKSAGRARRVVVAGCLVNRDADKLFDLAPGIDAVVGVNDRDDLLAAATGKRRVSMITPYGDQGEGARAATHGGAGAASTASEISSIASDAGRFRLTPRHTAYLRISEGCSQRCTFCTIPAIRGPFRSKSPQQVLAEARELIADGAMELNVIGQDTTSYGMDLPEAKTNLAGLMRSLDGLDGVQWVRLLYAYPNRFGDALIDTLTSCEKIVPYVDIPLQHIADGVLRRMGRRVTRQRTETLLGKLRDRVKGMTIRTTFIVGFPGETQADFRELLAFVKDFKFDALGVFEYSPEEGTPSARMDKQVLAELKRERAGQIMLAQQKIAFAANRRRVGKPLRVLVDGTDAQGRCLARHAGQAPDIDSICLLGQPRPTGQFVTAKVIAADGYDLVLE